MRQTFTTLDKCYTILSQLIECAEIYCPHADAYPDMAVSQKELTKRFYNFYLMASSNP